ncbi:hypothetical protein BXU01_03635 [[Flexibacter] sp. ATCC 35103]|nr:hypothetical protein BXU01_03635 [[Flexibacter] sp. ATCC 35103]
MFSKFIKIIVVIFLDLAVYIFCGVYLMGYDDFYEESQGKYFSLSSMETKFKIVWIFLNFWQVLNCFLLFYILFKGYEKFALK